MLKKAGSWGPPIESLTCFLISLGIGSGLAYMGSMVAVGEHFDKYRPMAFGLSTCGIGIGSICFPWITSSLIDYYGWRGALLVTAGLVLHVCVAAMLVLPIKKHKTNSLKKKPRRVFIEHSGNIFKNKSFLLLCVNTVFLEVTASVVYTHIAAYAESEGHSSDVGNLLITVLGIATIGKLPFKTKLHQDVFLTGSLMMG